MKSRPLLLAIPTILLAAAPSSLNAQPPKVLEFRVQTVNNKTYFHVRLEEPADFLAHDEARPRRFVPWGEGTDPLTGARLVPQDDGARLVYGREAFADPSREMLLDKKGAPDFKKDGDAKQDFKDQGPVLKDDKKDPNPGDKQPQAKDDRQLPQNTLEFFGTFTGARPARFLLLYPKDPAAGETKKRRLPLLGKLGLPRRMADEAKDEKPKQLSLYELLEEKSSWGEVAITLDPGKAKKVPLPTEGFWRDESKPVPASDLEGNWATAQAAHFSELEARALDFGFYGFAREATSRLYKVRSAVPWRPGLQFERGPDGGPGRNPMRLYEVTTGAAAITESLAIERMRNRGQANPQKEEARTIAIASVPGVDIEEHPWKKMMGDKKPAPEPLAQLVPNDNYYIHFKTITKFLDTGDLLDQWGTTLGRAVEVNSRDYRVKQKLEQQICLKSTGMARLFGPAVIKSLVITGNDPYLREGSDFTIIFQIASEALFHAGTAPPLAEARLKFGKHLKEDRSTHEGVAIESFTTPLREVSLHRALFDGFAIYSNSPVGLRRVIDAHKGKIRRLADALDFQYMRTIFRLDDPAEDGFVFLSDAFIRNLVGPPMRIKERRRLEALTSLHMLTDGALFTGWETGKPPQNLQHLLAATGMSGADLFTPDGNAVTWDQEHRVASSNFYNTIHFATPLVEIPIDQVTPTEERDYTMFRNQYMGLWRRYFDPIGIRLALDNQQVRMETYILPLVRTTQYNELRRMTGGGTVTIHGDIFSDKTLLQYLMHVAPDFFELLGVSGPGSNLWFDMALRSWLGDWWAVRLDDSRVYGKLLESYIRREMFPEQRHDLVEDLKRVFEVPLTIGFEVRSPVIFAGILTAARKTVENTLPGALEWGPYGEPYHGVSIVRIKANGERLGRGIVGDGAQRLNPEFYYALVDGGFFVSLREEPIKDIIDRSSALKDRKSKGETAEVNASLYLSPKAAVQSSDLVKLYLEWETHRRAQLNNALLYGLYRSNVVGPLEDGHSVETAAIQYLGFVPVSPDLAPFRYDRAREEVVNTRHGSLRQPKLQRGVDGTSPLGRLLEQFVNIRADLRFREDGIHTVLTLRKSQ